MKAKEILERINQRKKWVSVTKLFPQPEGKCAVCKRPIDDGRKRYCSDHCRAVAYACQKLFAWSHLREYIFARDNYTCQNCGHQDPSKETLELDHIKPVSKGGKNFDVDNLQTLCRECNRRKYNKEEVPKKKKSWKDRKIDEFFKEEMRG